MRTAKGLATIACSFSALLSACAADNLRNGVSSVNERSEQNQETGDITDLFHVGFDLEWGYYLSSLDGKERRIWVLFASEQSRASFDKAFSDESLKASFGKVMLCRCKGRYETRSAGLYFHVTQADFEYREPQEPMAR